MTTTSSGTKAPSTKIASEKLNPASTPGDKNAYLVQIASFKSKQEAERMKASLALKGFVVSIAVVNQQQAQWYRIILGPYASRTQAEKARSSLAQSEHLAGMIRRMDG
jgi:cell division protein FtsN